MDILLLREEEQQSDKYHAAFKESGFDSVTSIPVLDFEFCNLGQLKDFIQKIDDYSGLVFTSKRAVLAFESVADNKAIQNISERNFNIYVVGQATEACIKKLGLVSCGAHTGSSKELHEFIFNKSFKGQKPLMFACGNLAAETLPRRLKEEGILMETVQCYRTIPNKMFVEKLNDYLLRRNPKVIAFFSPSGASFYLSHLKTVIQGFENVKITTVGRYTQQEIEKMGQKVDAVAEKPTPVALIEAIKNLEF